MPSSVEVCDFLSICFHRVWMIFSSNMLVVIVDANGLSKAYVFGLTWAWANTLSPKRTTNLILKIFSNF